MRLVASACLGVFCYLAAGFATGSAPVIRRRSPEGAGWAARRQVWLTQAGADLTPAQFLLGSVVAGAICFGVVLGLTRAPVVALVPAVTIGMLPSVWFSRRRSTRLSEVQQSWPDGVRHLIGAVTSGMSLHQAIVELAGAGPEPLREAFERFEVNSRIVGTEAALEIVKEQLADPTSDRVLEVLILANQRGGRIVPEVLRDLAEATAKDLKAQDEIVSERLEQKINSRAVFALPWFVLVVMTAAPGPFREFYRSLPGLLVVIAGAILSVIGMALVARLSKDPVEQRVFGAGSQAGRP